MSGFQADKFRAAKYEHPTDFVVIPALAEYFPEGQEPKFVVRGLDAHEFQKAVEAGERQKKLDGIIKALTNDKAQIEIIRSALGTDNDPSPEIAKRQELIVRGSVEPKLSHADVAKMAEVCPIEFYDLSNKVTILTGQGGSRVKRQPSSPATIR